MSRLRRTVLTGAAVILGAAASLVVAAPALAVTGRVLISADSPADLELYKGVSANCPPGTVVLGGGADIAGGNGVIQIYHIAPNASGTGILAAATEHSGWRDGVFITPTIWSLRAYAICGSGVTGHQIVITDFTAERGDTGGSASASCPAGKQVIGMGGAVYKSRYILDSIDVNAALTTVSLQWWQAIPAVPGDYDSIDGWGHVWAICVNPVAGLQRVRAVSDWSSSNKAVSVGCPPGTTLHSAGGGTNGADRSVKLDAIVPGSTFVFVDAKEKVYGTPETWRAFAVGICAP